MQNNDWTEQDVYFVEDYSLNGNEEIGLCLFNVSAFYREVAKLCGMTYDRLMHIQGLPMDNASEYAKILNSVQLSSLFIEAYVSKNYEVMFRSYSAEFVLFANKKIVSVKRIRDDGNFYPNRVRRRAVFDANYYRKKLQQRLQAPKRFVKKNFCAKYATIVNVGFGNCCILFNEENVVVIDCSNQETKRSSLCQTNIDAAITWIKSIQNNKSFHIDVFLLTHPHYDHFSGVFNLMKYMDNETDFYNNCYYLQNSSAYTALLGAICNSHVNIVDPIVSNSTNCLKIIHPDKSFVKCSKVNNASVLSSVLANKKYFVFPGDIENSCTREGWHIVQSNVKTIIQNAGYYILSHHGSSNGCDNQPSSNPNKAIPNAPNFTFCSTRRTRRFPNVPDKTTLGLFKNCKRTDAVACKYIEVDFINNSVKYK